MNTEASRLVYFFGDNARQCAPQGKDVVGGKGASLAAMSCAELPVPPGFTISIPCCRYYHEHSRGSLRELASCSRSEQRLWPEGLEGELQANMLRLEELTGKGFGKGADPLLVSVRSGAAESMPGMLDTILNCGLHPALATEVPDEAHFWTVYAQFVRQFAYIVEGIPLSSFDDVAEKLDERAETTRTLAEAHIQLYERESDREFPVTAWDTLRECINAVFESWNNERACIYRKVHGLEHLEGTAVNVQSMFNSQVSGVAFTANPAKPAAEEIIVESSYGLGESIVSGDVTPDRFVLDHTSLGIKEQMLGQKDHVITGLGRGSNAGSFDPAASSLGDNQITEVGRLALKVEAHFGFPVDIEWGLADGKFSLLQSRAIRGLDVARDAEVGRREEIERLKRLVSDSRKKDKVWIVHNLAETLQTPTPLTWDIIRRFMSGNGGFGRMYKDFGYRPSKRVCEAGFLELVCGRIYADSDRVCELFWESMPLAYDHQELLANPRLLDTAPTKFDADRSDQKFLLRLPGNLLAMFRARGRIRRARRDAVKLFEEVELPRFLQYVNEKREQNLAEMPTDEVIAELHDRVRCVLTDFGRESLKPGFFGGCARLELEAKLTQLLGRVEGEKLTQVLISGLAGDTTVEQNAMLFRVSQGEETMEAFLERYGHRCAGEMDLANPRWREDDAYLRQIVDNRKINEEHSPASLHKRNEVRREQAMRELPDVLAQWGGSFMREEIEGLAVESQTLLPYRETGKHYLMMGYDLIRTVILELGRRWKLDNGIFFLHLDELEQLENGRDQLVHEIPQRKIRWQSAQLLDLPNVISSDNLDDLGLPRQIDAASELEASSLAAGVVTGIAHIAFSPSDATDLGDDCILVCPSTDPSWTALFTTIKGLIVERGGVLSHGAITARDFSIPAVACPDATQIIKNGVRVRVDGDRGHISIFQD